MSKETTSRPGGSGTKPQSAKGPTKPVAGAQKNAQRPAQGVTGQPRKASADRPQSTNRPGSATNRPGGATAQQRAQARQEASRQKAGGGFKIRPLDMILLGVGVIVVGFVVWSIVSGSNQATPGTTGQTGGPTADSTPLPEGVAAPNFTLPGADGKNYSLSDYKGKVVLLEFFAPWCPHCRDDAPIFNNVAARYKDNPNVQVLALSASPWGKDYVPGGPARPPITMDDIKWFQNEYKVSFPMLLDKELSAATDYSIMFYPTVYIVDQEGKIAAQPAGYFVWQDGQPVSSRAQPLTEETLAARIDALLK